MAILWTDPSARPPVFLDFETQTDPKPDADLKQIGGRRYAEHPRSRVLSLVVLIDDVVHIWIPSTLFQKCPKSLSVQWPPGHSERDHMTWLTPYLPTPIAEAARAGRLFVGHNVLNFDRFIWREKVRDADGNPVPEPPWADTLLLARTAGLPGDLDKLSQAAVDQGKDTAKRLLKKLMYRTDKTETLDAHAGHAGHVGTLTEVVRYNIADVLLLEKLWQQFEYLPVEADVIEAHDRINERGIRVDTDLLNKLSQVAEVSVNRAADEIARLTDGDLSLNNIRSTKQVHQWLNTHGVYIRDYEGKATLRKNVVEQALANPWMMLDDDNISVEAVRSIPPEVFDVLRLRAAALRITAPKTARAMDRVSADGRIRDLFSYWMAHTGRWSSQGVQVHNLPRPKKGVSVPDLIRLHESGEWGPDPQAAYDLIRGRLIGKLTVDDALSALIRASFIPADGCYFVIADFAAIECRGVAWCADQTDLLDSLASGRDIYCEFASRIFNRTVTPKDDLERQIGKICILGLGYGMGAEKFRIFCGLAGVDLDAVGISAEQCVELYRGTYKRIAGEQYAGSIQGMTYRKGGLWDRLHWAVHDVVSGRSTREVAGKCIWTMDGGGTLVCTLPSGRQLRYRNARIEDRVPGYAKWKGVNKTKATLVYDGPRGESYLYGGKITENIVQAICRDLLAATVVRMESDGYPVVAHVHDEVVLEVPADRAGEALEALCRAMTTPPAWAAGFPIATEGFTCPRYYKSAPPGFAKLNASSSHSA